MIRSHQRIDRNLNGVIVLFMLVVMTALSGCAHTDRPHKSAMMANPASVYCKDQGGHLEIRREKDGDVGYCHLAYGRVVEEWVLYRAAHHQAS